MLRTKGTLAVAAARNRGAATPLRAALATAAFLAGSAGQLHCHALLGRLGGEGRRKRYGLPEGGLWDVLRVSSPHYACEILIYGALAAAAPCAAAAAMLLWVCCNLAVSAAATHAWYLRKFPNSGVVRARRRLVPRVW